MAENSASVARSESKWKGTQWVTQCLNMRGGGWIYSTPATIHTTKKIYEDVQDNVLNKMGDFLLALGTPVKRNPFFPDCVILAEFFHHTTVQNRVMIIRMNIAMKNNTLEMFCYLSPQEFWVHVRTYMCISCPPLYTFWV